MWLLSNCSQQVSWNWKPQQSDMLCPTDQAEKEYPIVIRLLGCGLISARRCCQSSNVPPTHRLQRCSTFVTIDMERSCPSLLFVSLFAFSSVSAGEPHNTANQSLTPTHHAL